MTIRPFVSHASTILDQVSMRAASAGAWTGVQVLSVVFVTVLTAAAAQLSFPLPFTPVPFTIQPMVVLIGAAALGSRLGTLSQIFYLMLGVAGLPVFAHAPELPQGVLRLLGPSGGYLMAFPLAAFATGWLSERGFRSSSSAGSAGSPRRSGQRQRWPPASTRLSWSTSSRSWQPAPCCPLRGDSSLPMGSEPCRDVTLAGK
jgi:biotin transport system substrate-specific component